MSLDIAAIIQWGVVIGASLIAAVLDLRARRIPNLLCGPLFITGLIWAAWQEGWTAWVRLFWQAFF